MPNRHSISVVVTLLTALVVLWPLVPTAQVAELVDLSVADHEHRLGSVPLGERMTIPPVVVSSHSSTPVPSVPLKVTVASLNSSSYAPFDSIVYEVVLENVSAESIACPSSVDETLFRRDVPGTTSMTASLQFDDDILGRQGFGFLEAYGSPAIDGTLVAIPPGGSVRLRGRGVVTLDNSHVQSKPWAMRSVAVRAVVSMWVIGKPVYRTVESINTLNIQIRER
jgi:hypothetical protein